jgi:NAD(P)-dependent dehydrogenase (short-subunit alcohol dehydrogenase family)
MASTPSPSSAVPAQPPAERAPAAARKAAALSAAAAPRKTVVITGASTGIGRATSLHLVRNGFRVFAGVRKQKDADLLSAAGGADLVPIELDVTDADSIATAAKKVGELLGARGLDGLVNNAGIGIAVPVEAVSMDALRRSFEIDVFGQIAVIQAFLPLIRRRRGRIVNMGSVGGHITIPFGGVLCACKSAFGSVSDALRLELHPFGIRVCLIEPGAIATPGVEKTLGDVEGAIASFPPEASRRYGPMFREFSKRSYERESKGSPPDVVARAVLHALTARRPRARYPVGKHSRLLGTLPRVLPDRSLDYIRRRLFAMPKDFGALAASFDEEGGRAA